MKHAGPLTLACAMLFASTAGAAPAGGANEIWIDQSGSAYATPADPATGALDWQRLESSELDSGSPVGSDDMLLTPTLDQFFQSLDRESGSGSEVPEGSYGTMPAPMDPNAMAAGGGAAGKSVKIPKSQKVPVPTPGPVPEPSTLLLAGASVLAIGGRKRFQAWRRKGEEAAND